ncbi:MAG: DegT/DnrJ/EryC1/StrS family aminotransferase [Planctomyces sp.]
MKTSVLQLAAFGGSPQYEVPIHVGQPSIPPREQLLAAMEQVLNSGILTNNGPQVRAFEQAIIRATGARHCVACCNATTALQIAARAMNLTGEVIMPSLTFVATAHAMEWIGLTPVFADVLPESQTMDPESAAACITSKTSALIPVHLWGHTCDVPQLTELARENNLRLLFDSSHAFGCRRNGIPVGNFGDAEVFSFHATKFVNSFEGGAIVTNNDQLAERCRRLRAFGITDLTEVSDIGINGKMHEISAAAGLVSLDLLPKLLETNERNREIYRTELADIGGITVLPIPETTESNLQYFVTMIHEEVLGLSRDQVVNLLRAEGIFARSYFVPGCHRSAPYVSNGASCHQRTSLPVTESILQEIMQLPTGMAIQPEDACTIGRMLRFIAENSGEISRLLRMRSGRIPRHPADPSRPRETPLREAG